MKKYNKMPSNDFDLNFNVGITSDGKTFILDFVSPYEVYL